MAEQAGSTGGGRIRGLFKAVTAAAVGLGGGVVATYTTAVVDRVAKPPKPVANFAVAADGLTVTCQNHATGDSGWWDFGDGTPLEPFAPDQPATHTYKKAADYTVKLTVRNFLSDEAERSVPVDLTASAPAVLKPSVKFTAEPVNPTATVAPATYRITGEVANAEKVIWDLGDGKTDVTTESGQFQRLVVYEKPGTFPIQVIGLAGKTAVKQASMASVSAPAAGALSLVLRIEDTASTGVTEDVLEYVRVTVPANGAVPSPGFEVVVPARKNRKIDDAVVRKFTSPAVRNVRVQVAPDKLSAKVTGEWALTGDALVKASADGKVVMVPLNTVQEKAVEWRNPIEWSEAMAPNGSQLAALMTMPPMPQGMANIQRRVRLEIRQASADGRGQALLTVPDVKLPWSGTVPPSAGLPAGGTATAAMVGNQLMVAVSTGTASASAAVQRPTPVTLPAPAASPAPPAHLPLRPYDVPSSVKQLGRTR